MNFDEFKNELKDSLYEYFGPEKHIVFSSVMKQNGIKLTGVNIFTEDTNITPAIYIDSYFEQYKKGRYFQSIVDEIISIYNEYSVEEEIDVSWFEDYSKAKELLFAKVLNKEKNEELLLDVPYVDFCDLAVVFYLVVDCSNCKGSILLHNCHVESWNVTKEELLMEALANNRKKAGFVKYDIVELLLEILKERNDENAESMIKELESDQSYGIKTAMYVLTNKDKMYGASVLLDVAGLEDFSKEIDDSFYILPSSLHEIIAIPAKAAETPSYLESMIKEVNRNEVPDGDFLSNHLYKYERDTKQVKIMNFA